MTDDPLGRLAAANPVPDPPQVAPVEHISRLIEADERATETRLESGPAAGSTTRRRLRIRVARIVAAAALLAALATGAGVLLSPGSQPGVNVLAAVYAAVTAPKPGILEAVTLTHMHGGPGHKSTQLLREWSQVSTQRRRGMTTITGSHIDPSEPQIIDALYAPKVSEAWSNTRGSLLSWDRLAANVIDRVHWSGSHLPQGRLGFLGGGLIGQEWVQLYRNLYQKGQMRVVGRERHRGRLLWKLEASPARAAARAREDKTRFYVLVDPHTFLPVYTRLINLALPGDPTVSDSELLSYRTLPATATNEKLLDLTAQHPTARVVEQVIALPAPR